MKRFLCISLVAAVAVVIVLLSHKVESPAAAPQTTNAIVASVPAYSNMNAPTSHAPPFQAIFAVTNATNLTPLLTNALLATNVSQWTSAVKGLRRSLGSSSWGMQVADPATHAPLVRQGVPLLLEKDGKTVAYNAHLITIDTKNDQGDILEIQLMSPIMNIDETRQLGLQLFEMLGLDSSGFQAWCNKTGNQLGVAPYSTGDHYYIIETATSYNYEYPWAINLLIMYPNSRN